MLVAASIPLIAGGLVTEAGATEPCGDFGECKVLIEINASDGDIGFHWLGDADGQRSTRIDGPNKVKIWKADTGGALREQLTTESIGESSEPLCWPDPEADPDEGIVTLEEFLERWDPGTYTFSGKGENGEKLSGETELTFKLPAAPDDVDFDGSVISWGVGDDLGECADFDRLSDLVEASVLPQHPEDVPVRAWEVVLEPDVEDGDPQGGLKFSIRVPGDISPMQVTVPADYLASLDDDTPVKIEVGAIGDDDNATFTEEDGFCVNEDEGCED